MRCVVFLVVRGMLSFVCDCSSCVDRSIITYLRSHINSSPHHHTRWLDARIREVAKREEAAERLAAEYQRRMALLKTKEDLEQARVKFFSTRRAGAAVVPAATTVRDVILGAHGPQEEEGVVGVEGTAGAEAVVAPAPLTPEEEATLEELEERITACKVRMCAGGVGCG